MSTTKRYTTIILLPVLMAVASCNKWLDVKPKDQVKDVELFSTESGFKEALSGIYATLSYENLYGKQLTFGLMGVLGIEWETIPLEYDADKRYDYTTSSVTVRRIDSIWARMYFSIANTNKLLQEIDNQKSIFTPDNYNIIKGEALALRAFLHFDLVRLFGASFAENPDKLAIPYQAKYSDEVLPQLTVSAFTNKAVADLTAAQELLKQSDPLFTGRNITVDDDNGYLLNRQTHLNYYAVRGLLARIYLYQRNYSKALECANEVINSGKFPWIKQDNITSASVADLTFSTEHLFALNIINLSTIANKYFTLDQAGSGIFSLSRDLLSTNYFENNTADYRYLYQFTEGVTGAYYLKKYYQLPSTTWPMAYRNKMPLLRLSEMYFIAAECLVATDITAAAGMINKIRTHRGIAGAVINASNFESIVANEFRREFIGEGQLFFYYKRHNRATVPRGSDYNLVQLKAYKLPMPQKEFENAARVDNR